MTAFTVLNLFMTALHSAAHKMAVEDDIFSALQHRGCLVGLHEQQTPDLDTPILTNFMLKIQNFGCENTNGGQINK